MQSVSPVFTDDEVKMEYVIAKDSADYLPVIGLKVSLQVVDRESKEIRILEDWGTAIRYRLTDEERAAIADSGDIVLTQLNFDKKITPMNLQICKDRKRPIFAATVDLPTEKEIEEARAEETGNVIEMPEKSLN